MNGFNHTLPDYGLKNDDITYLHVNSIIDGRGPDRLKYLDIEGRWHLNGRSIPYISSVFNHLQHLNDAQVPFRDIIEEPLNAIGLIGWKGSEGPPPVVEEPPKKVRKPFKVKKPIVEPKEEIDDGTHQLPHRSAGYGPSPHEKRKIEVTIRSRSTSPRTTSPLSSEDGYMSPRGKVWSRPQSPAGDLGYSSGAPSPMAQKLYVNIDELEWTRPPHRTPSLSPIQHVSRKYDKEEKKRPQSESRQRDSHYTKELKVVVTESGPILPHRSHGYGDSHVRRQYDISPRSDTTSASASPVSRSAEPYNCSADHALLSAFHLRGSRKENRENETGNYPPMRREIHGDWTNRRGDRQHPSQKQNA